MRRSSACYDRCSGCNEGWRLQRAAQLSTRDPDPRRGDSGTAVRKCVRNDESPRHPAGSRCWVPMKTPPGETGSARHRIRTSELRERESTLTKGCGGRQNGTAAISIHGKPPGDVILELPHGLRDQRPPPDLHGSKTSTVRVSPAAGTCLGVRAQAGLRQPAIPHLAEYEVQEPPSFDGMAEAVAGNCTWPKVDAPDHGFRPPIWTPEHYVQQPRRVMAVRSHGVGRRAIPDQRLVRMRVRLQDTTFHRAKHELQEGGHVRPCSVEPEIRHDCEGSRSCGKGGHTRKPRRLRESAGHRAAVLLQPSCSAGHHQNRPGTALP